MQAVLSSVIITLSLIEKTVPLPLFALIGSIIEEIISPIPATLVLGVIGSYYASIDGSLIALSVLILIATAGKTFAAWATYWLGQRLGVYVIRKWGKYFGLDHAALANTNLRLQTRRSWGIIFAMRSLPIAPSAAVSISSGILKIDQRTFLSATFLGYILRNIFITFTGYSGLNIFKNWEAYANNPYYGALAIALLISIAIYLLVKAYKKYYQAT